MKNPAGNSTIVLTYKRKVLLKRQEDNVHLVNKNTWSFIEDVPTDQKSPEYPLLQEVEQEMHITLSSIKLLLSYADSVFRNNFYLAGLTDKHVNDLQRPEGQEVQFFTMKEVEILSLAETTKRFFTQCKSEIEASFIV